MADERRGARGRGRPGSTARSGPGGPGRAGGRGSRDRRSGARIHVERRAEQRRAEQRAAAAEARLRAERRQRSRLTGRAAILVLVLAVLAVSFASSLRAYLQQRSQIDALQSQIAERKDAIEELEQEKERWLDPSYVAQQARLLGYVAVGDRPFIVIDENGDPLDPAAELDDPPQDDNPERTWIDDLWASTRVAGDPPTTIAPPPSEHLSDGE